MKPGFTRRQLDALACDLDTAMVRQRKQAGGITAHGERRVARLSYVEGWVVIHLLNTVFGPDGWGHELEREHIYHWTGKDKRGNDRRECESVCMVRLVIPGKPDTVEVGGGNGFGSTCTQDALKEASTDGLKRCAKNLGWSMGLALYDRAKKHIKDGALKRFMAAATGPATSDYEIGGANDG